MIGLRVWLVACLAIGLVACAPTRRSTRGAAGAMPSPPARDVTASPERAHALAARVRALGSTRGDFTLVASEAEVTSYLAEATSGSPVERLTVWFVPDAVHTRATVVLGRRPVEIIAVLRLAAHEGTIAARLEHGTWNGRRIPRFVMTSVQEALNDALEDVQLGVAVKTIALTKGHITLTGTID